MSISRRPASLEAYVFGGSVRIELTFDVHLRRNGG
jgi:hypothetical protein